jgi:hypothetical protein
VLGLLTGSGYLDFGILINGVLNLPLLDAIFANAAASRPRRRAILIGYGWRRGRGRPPMLRRVVAHPAVIGS